MLKKKSPKQAVFTVEYAFFIIMLVLAFFATFTYMRRAFSGYWRSMTDTFGHGKQYEEPTPPPPTPPPPSTSGTWRVIHRDGGLPYDTCQQMLSSGSCQDGYQPVEGSICYNSGESLTYCECIQYSTDSFVEDYICIF